MPTAPEGTDLKSFEIYAQNIADDVDDNFGKDDEGYIFAISAKWGAGKTKLLRLISPLLEEKGYEVVTYCAWQYSQDPETLRRTFLKTISDSIKGSPLKSWFLGKNRNLARLDHEVTKTALALPPAFIVLMSLVIVAILGIAFWLFGWLGAVMSGMVKGVQFVKNNALLSSLILFIITLFSLPKLLQVQKKSSRITSVDEFESLFKDMTKKAGKLIVFIDDLDRCTPEGAKLVLDALKTFFLKPNVSYIVTGDHTVLERYMGEQMRISPIYNEDGTIDAPATDIAAAIEGQRYMQKIFNVYWKLPPIEPSERNHLLAKILQDSSYLNDSDKGLISALLTAYLDKTPREIKRFVSLLNFSLRTAHTRLLRLKDESDETSKQIAANLQSIIKQPALLAKLLLMQEKFGNLFEYFSDNPNAYTDLEGRVLRNGKKTDDDKEWEKYVQGNGLTKFIDFIKTPPTIHNAKGTRIMASTEAFFYYSGFAGMSNSGIIEEDFLARYILPDESLAKDFLAIRPAQNRNRVLQSGIKNLDSIKDRTQLKCALTHLLGLLGRNTLSPKESLASIISGKALSMAWQESEASERQEVLEKLVRATLKYGDYDSFNILVNSEPWQKEIAPMWQHIDFSILDERFMTAVTTYVARVSDNSDADTVKRQYFEQNLKALTDAPNRSEESLAIACTRLADDPFGLETYNYVSETTFSAILEGLTKLASETEKAHLLLNCMKKDHPLWVMANRPAGLNKLRKGSLLHKHYGDQVAEAFNSWKGYGVNLFRS